MRKATQNIVGVISLGVLATSWSLGQAAETGLSLAASEPTSGTSAAPEATATDTPTTQPGVETSTTTELTQNTASVPTPTKSASSAPSAAPTQKANGGSQTGSAIQYKYGVIQVEVVKSGSTITAVNLIQAGTRGPDWAVVPDMLAEAAVSANGSSFGNVSGATFTTQAFKQALESALAKF